MAEQKVDNKDTKEEETEFTVGELHLTIKSLDGTTLYVSAKNMKTKATFSEYFPKSALNEKKLHQPAPQVVKMILAAKNDFTDQLSLEFGYIAPSAKVVNIKDLQSKGKSGDALCMVMKQNIEMNVAEFVFKLMPHKHDQIDVLERTIGDLRNEIVSLKQQLVPAVAEWKSTRREGDNKRIYWNVVKLEPTLQGMAKTVDSDRSIEIGVKGLYRIDVRLQYTDTCGSGSGSKTTLKINDEPIAEFKAIVNTLIRGSMSEIVHLQRGDKVSVWGSCTHSMDPLYNHLILQKLC